MSEAADYIPVKQVRTIQDMHKGAGNLRDALLWTAGPNWALRVSDLLAVNVGDVRGKKGNIRKAFNVMQQKTRKPVNCDITPKVKRAIDYGGYGFVAIYLNLVGTVTQDGKDIVLKSRANGQVFHLVDSKRKPWNPRSLLGREVSIQGTVPKSYLGGKGKQASPRVQVTSASAAKVEDGGQEAETKEL